MGDIVSGLFFVNGIDVWTRFGVFLTEEKKNGRDNLTAILSASKTKKHTAVNIRENNGEKYPYTLVVANEARSVILHFALYAPTKSEWLKRYLEFISFLKTGEDGWLTLYFPQLDITIRGFYQDSSDFKPLTYLWREGVQASHFKIKFWEPEPII